MEQRHQVEPRLDGRAVHQRRRNIRRQQSRASARYRAIRGIEQAALALPARGLREFQAFARGLIDRHRFGRARQPGRTQEWQGTARGVIEIGDQPARRRQRRARELAVAIQRLYAEQRLQSLLAARAVELASGPLGRRQQGVITRCGGDRLGRRQSRQIGRKSTSARFDDVESSRRNIRGRDRHMPRGFADARAPIAAARIEQRFFRQRARRHHADDPARHQRLRSAALLRLGRALRLVGDRDTVPGLDQPRQIPFGGMRRHAAHRDLLAVVLPARGERDIQARRRHPCIVEEQFEEIAHTVEQQAILCLGLEAEILGHHRGGSGRHRPRR